MLLAVSRIHESVPLFLVDGVRRRLPGTSFRGRKIAVLGLAFKSDTDDERDSLSFKLIRLLERDLALVAAHDPHSPSSTLTFEEAVTGAEAVVLATNHSTWQNAATLERVAELAAPGAVLADPWNCFGQHAVFGDVRELAVSVTAAAAPA